MPTASWAVSRRRLGHHLRWLRQVHARLAAKTVCEELEWSTQKLWRIENGRVATHPLDVEAMCRLYDTDPETTKALKALARLTFGRRRRIARTDAIGRSARPIATRTDTTIDLGGARWRTSSHNGGSNRIEVATNLPGIVAVRDGMDPGHALVFPLAEWRAFLAGVRAGDFDL